MSPSELNDSTMDMSEEMVYDKRGGLRSATASTVFDRRRLWRATANDVSSYIYTKFDAGLERSHNRYTFPTRDLYQARTITCTNCQVSLMVTDGIYLRCVWSRN